MCIYIYIYMHPFKGPQCSAVRCSRVPCLLRTSRVVQFRCASLDVYFCMANSPIGLGLKAGLLDKMSKITFPIPGKLRPQLATLPLGLSPPAFLYMLLCFLLVPGWIRWPKGASFRSP